MVEPEWMEHARALVGKEYGRIYAWDKVNAPMIRQWCEIMGVDASPYLLEGGVHAPESMLQVWCMEGFTLRNYPPGSTTENPFEVLNLMEIQGLGSVVAVNSELQFIRAVREGERLYYTTRLDSVSPEKITALGTGYFVTFVMRYFSEIASGDQEVGELLFRVFKFKPAQVAAPGAAASAPTKPKRPAPGISNDTQFFWEGARSGQLRIQRCTACGTLRHPPGPVCSQCHSFEWEAVTASGRGQVYSFVVMHYPEVPPFEYPNVIALIELEEGTRLITQLVGIAPTDVRIGQKVQAEFHSYDGGMVLPQFRPVRSAN